MMEEESIASVVSILYSTTAFEMTPRQLVNEYCAPTGETNVISHY